MRTLILGGTVFLGRHVAAEALARGHELTLFTRGLHGAGLFPEAERLRGDRGRDVSALRGREWDAVIDTSGYAPADVAASSEALAGSGAHLVFVSSINAYPGWPAQTVDEDSPAWETGPDEYGPNKAAAERAAEAALPGRVAAVRAGLLVGPHDGVFRLPWWVKRIAEGGDVPAPGDPSRPLQIIDARDLAAWMLELAERRVAGTFNGTGPAGMTTMGELLEAAVDATGSGARLRWIPDGALRAQARSRGTSSRCGRPRTRWPGRGGSARSARRPPGCAAGRSRRRSPAWRTGCATAARPRWGTGARTRAPRR